MRAPQIAVIGDEQEQVGKTSQLDGAGPSLVTRRIARCLLDVSGRLERLQERGCIANRVVGPDAVTLHEPFAQFRHRVFAGATAQDRCARCVGRDPMRLLAVDGERDAALDPIGRGGRVEDPIVAVRRGSEGGVIENRPLADGFTHGDPTVGRHCRRRLLPAVPGSAAESR